MLGFKPFSSSGILIDKFYLRSRWRHGREDEGPPAFDAPAGICGNSGGRAPQSAGACPPLLGLRGQRSSASRAAAEPAGNGEDRQDPRLGTPVGCRGVLRPLRASVRRLLLRVRAPASPLREGTAGGTGPPG